MEQRIIEIIADYQDRQVSDYNANQTFVEMGLDSLDLAELVIQLEDSMGITVDLTPEVNTPAKLAAFIATIK